MRTPGIVTVTLTVTLATLAALVGCVDHHNSSQGSSDDLQRAHQERILREGTAQVGMPAIKNFREKRQLKRILEDRDQEGLTTYTYTYSEMTGRTIFFCDSIGYGIPYATQYTNPGKLEDERNGADGVALATLPQADPNGLFSPAAAEGTWIMCKDPNGPDARPVYVEPRVIVSPFRLVTPSTPAEKTEGTAP